MTLLAGFRQRRTPWARRALLALSVVWLNVALQPCVMALGSPDEHRCPHCPPAHEQPHAQNHQQHLRTGSVQVQTHDSAEAKTSCADSEPDCGGFDSFAHDGRGFELKPKSGGELFYLLDAWPAVAISTIASAPVPDDCRTPGLLPGSPPPLHKLYCVYLK